MIYKTSSSILFYFNVVELFDKVQQHTGMVAKSLPNADIEALYVTSDDSDFFHRVMVKATTNAYELCHKLTTNLPKGMLLNEPINIAAITTGTIVPGSEIDSIPEPTVNIYVYGFYVKNLLGHYEHSLTIINEYIELLLIDVFQREWWLKHGIADLYKVAVSDTAVHTVALNNAMYSLYKPKVVPIPSWSVADVTVEVTTTDGVTTTTETDNSVGSTTTDTPTSTTPEILYFDSLSQFPEIGTADIVYVDRSTNIMYDWNGIEYQPYAGAAGEYSVLYENVNSLVVNHNLKSMSPYVVGTDADGNTFIPDYTPTDVDSGVASWITVNTGILRFNA